MNEDLFDSVKSPISVGIVKSHREELLRLQTIICNFDREIEANKDSARAVAMLQSKRHPFVSRADTLIDIIARYELEAAKS